MALTNHDARMVLGMIARGDKQHDIAAWFGESQARIVEVEKGSHGSLTVLPESDLPPKGSPGPKGKLLRGSVNKAIRELETGNSDEALRTLKAAIEKYDRREA